MSRLEQARRTAEDRLRDLRTSLDRELGGAPTRQGLWLLVAAGAVGLALALRGVARRRRKKEKDVTPPSAA